MPSGQRDHGGVGHRRRMDDGRLTRLFGAMLREQRERRGLTQEKLAILAEVSQATVARIERGSRSASLPMLERLFEALHLQVTLGVEPLDAHLDAVIDTQLSTPLADRVAATDIERVLGRLAVPFAFDGTTAALLQGAPVPVGDIEIALRWSDADAFTEWLTANHGQRWHARWETFGYLDLDPRRPGEHRWRTIPGIIRARMCDRLPDAIDVSLGGRIHPVVPLADLQIDDPHVADLLRRYGERREATR